MEFTIARDKNNDLYLDNSGNISLVYDKDAYAQIVNALMRTVRGEVLLNRGAGLPYFSTVFKNRNLVEVWRAEAIIAISKLSFVKSVISLSCYIDGDVLKYTSEIETDNGVVTANG